MGRIEVSRVARFVVLLIGMAFGLGLWLVSALFFGEPEPWDSDGQGYPVALVGSGLILGFLGPNQRSIGVGGVFAGQLLVFLGRVVAHPETRELWILGAVFLAGYTLVLTGAGVLVGGAARRWLAPRHRPDE